jgi:hypothetical protein
VADLRRRESTSVLILLMLLMLLRLLMLLQLSMPLLPRSPLTPSRQVVWLEQLTAERVLRQSLTRRPLAVALQSGSAAQFARQHPLQVLLAHRQAAKAYQYPARATTPAVRPSIARV